MRNKNIFKFEPKSKEILTTEEIMKVFTGFVRLIQKSADYMAFEKVQGKINQLREKLEQTEQELNKRTYQVSELLQLNDELIEKLNNKNN